MQWKTSGRVKMCTFITLDKRIGQTGLCECGWQSQSHSIDSHFVTVLIQN